MIDGRPEGSAARPTPPEDTVVAVGYLGVSRPAGRTRRFLASRTVRRLRRNRVAVVALGFVTFLVVLSLVAPLLPLQEPSAQTLSRRLEGPSGDYLLGTDKIGRDVLSRLVHAGRISLAAAAQAVSLAVLFGVPLGMLAGYLGGWLDAIISRLVDVVMSLPAVILALAIVAILGPGLTNAMVAIGVIMAPTFYRVARATSRDVRTESYIEAAAVSGCTRGRILFRHVLPNAASPLLVQLSFAAGVAIVAEASLSYLGLGAQPPQSSWGTMVADGHENLRSNAFLIVPPALTMSMAILALATLGDAVRDALGRNTGRAS